MLATIVGQGHEGNGAGTGEPSVLEQMLKRPGTVDFEQLISAGCLDIKSKGQSQPEPATPNPSVPSMSSAPNTPLVPPDSAQSAPPPAVVQQAPPEPKPKSEPKPPPDTTVPDESEDMADEM